MADPIRRRRADDDVSRREIVVEQPPPDLADFDVLEAFRQSRAPVRTPAPAADPTTMDAIREGIAAEAAAQNTPAANTRRANAALSRANAEAARETPISNMAMRQNAADALTLGFADELYGAGRGAYDAATSDMDVDAAYRRARDRFRSDMADASARYPRQAAMGAMAGNAAGMVLPLPGVLGRLGQGATWGRRALGAAGLGAIYGGLSGLGHSEVDLTDPDLTAPIVPTENLSPNVAAEIPTRGGQLARDVGYPLAQGAVFGGAMSAGIDALRGGYGLFRAARDRARLSKALGDRSDEILRSGRIPRLRAGPMDDLALEDALATADDARIDDAIREAITPQGTSLTDMALEPLRADPNVQRLRAAGVVGKPNLLAVSRMQGGIPQAAADLATLGVSQPGEVMMTRTGLSRSEAIRQIAGRQRENVLRQAMDAGVSVEGQEIAAALRERARRMQGSTVPDVQAQARDLLEQADVFEGLLDPVTRQPPEVPLSEPRRFTLPEVDQAAAEWANNARYDQNRGNAVPAPSVANARDIRADIVNARQNALANWNPELAQDFSDAQRAYQLGVTASPTGRASETTLREANRNLGLTDYLAGGGAIAAGAKIGTALGGPVGGLVGVGLGGVGASLGNRMYRELEPSIFATLNEGPAIRQQLQQMGIVRPPSGLPSGLRFLSEQLQLRGPRVVGNAMGTPDRPEPLTTAEPGGATATSSDVDAPIDPRAGLPMPGQDAGASAPVDTDDVDAPIDPFAGLPMPGDENR